jgi:hypothetical protein
MTNIIEDLNPRHSNTRRTRENRRVYCQVFLIDLNKCSTVEVRNMFYTFTLKHCDGVRMTKMGIPTGKYGGY